MHTAPGWRIPFRMHDANTMIEPSPQFDVRWLGGPQALPGFKTPLL